MYFGTYRDSFQVQQWGRSHYIFVGKYLKNGLIDQFKICHVTFSEYRFSTFFNIYINPAVRIVYVLWKIIFFNVKH